jgi:hypothetical protein
VTQQINTGIYIYNNLATAPTMVSSMIQSESCLTTHATRSERVRNPLCGES